MVNKAWQSGILKRPLSDSNQEDYPIVQYADDTLLIMPGDARVLFNLKGLLRSFSDSAGLHVNFAKSFLVPINMSNDRATHLANTFGCQVGTSPSPTWVCPLEPPSPPSLNKDPCLQKQKNGYLALVR